jgi:hypothetical protein
MYLTKIKRYTGLTLAPLEELQKCLRIDTTSEMATRRNCWYGRK